MVAFAIVSLGMRKDDFEWLTPNEYHKCVAAWSEQREHKIRHDYELSRFNAWLSLTPNIRKPRTPQDDVIRFPWEVEEIKKGKVIEWQDQSTIKR